MCASRGQQPRAPLEMLVAPAASPRKHILGQCWAGCSSPCSTNHMLWTTVLRWEPPTASAARTSQNILLSLVRAWIPVSCCSRYSLAADLVLYLNSSRGWAADQPWDFSAQADLQVPGEPAPEYQLQVPAISLGATKAPVPTDTLYIAFLILISLVNLFQENIWSKYRFI